MKGHHTKMGEQCAGSLKKFILKTPDVTAQRKGETEEVNSPSCFLGVSVVYLSKAAGISSKAVTPLLLGKSACVRETEGILG